MKKIITLVFLPLFFLVHGTGLGEFNLFQQRKIVIGSLENRSGSRYDYIGNILKSILYQAARTIPFVTLTDEERAFLAELSHKEGYSDLYNQAGEKIGYRMEPVIEIGETHKRDYPLFIDGNYRVLPEEPRIEQDTDAAHGAGERIALYIHVHNLMTGRRAPAYYLEQDLNRFLNDPSPEITPFFRQFLRYKTHTVSLTAEPPDALISVDNKLAGIGTVKSLLVTPGFHRINVKREGYEEYTDLVLINDDAFSQRIQLYPEKDRIFYRVTTNVPDTEVFVDEEYAGISPLMISTGREDHTITLIKEGYRTETVSIRGIPEEGGNLYIGLMEPAQKELIYTEAEDHKRKARLLTWAGLGMLGWAVVFGVQTTLNAQRADLYAAGSNEKYDEALLRSRIFNTLTISSIILSSGIFTLSFIETVKYFKLYNLSAAAGDGDITILKTEVPF